MAAATAAAAVDLELKKAFTDLQMQVLMTREKVAKMTAEIDILSRATMGMKITNKTLETLLPEHRTYESIGRIFVHRDRAALSAKIAANAVENEKKIKQLESNKQYHESKVKESENNLRELITQKKLGAAK